MNLTRILTVILLIASLGLGYYLYSGIQEVIDTTEKIKTTKDAIIEKLHRLTDDAAPDGPSSSNVKVAAHENPNGDRSAPSRPPDCA